MRLLKKFVWLAYFVIVADSVAMLGGAFEWHSWVPATLALTSAAVALSPVSRKVGTVACALWVAYALLSTTQEKYCGPLGFAAFSALFVAITTSLAPNLAAWMLVPVTFVQAAWVSSLARQSVYEIATFGHLTPTVDECVTYFLPLIFGVLLVSIVAATVLAKVLVAVYNDVEARSLSPNVAARFEEKGGRVAFSIALTPGAIVGLAIWRDWQINTPCM